MSARSALVVLGYHEFRPDRGHGISDVCKACVRRAEEIAEQTRPAVVVLSGWSSTGGRSEAEQMRDLWRTPGPDLLLEPRARNTAENAAYSLRMLLDHGGIDHVTVVCSIRHRVRVPFLFGRLFREHGIRIAYDYVRRPLPRPAIWFQEAVGLTLMPLHRRQAEKKLSPRRQWGRKT